MGLFSFLGNEFIDVIEWIEDSPDIVMYKWPDSDKAIKNGAQLTVREAQTALFVNEGQFGDQYMPGRHQLTTANMPITTKLKSWKYAFESPFKVDIYYFSTKQFTNLKWGTPNPIMMRDPQFKQVRVQAFGNYYIRIKDPKTFFTQFSGTSSKLMIGEVEQRLRDAVVSKFAEILGEANVSVLDMAANYSEIGAKIKPGLQELFDTFGIELTQFQIASTTLPPEVSAFYDKMTNMNMVGDMAKFQQFQILDAMDKAAENGGGGEGVNIGGAMLFANLVNQQQPQMNKNTGGSDDVMETLKKLADLKTAGVLSEEEFEAKKKDLLSRI